MRSCFWACEADFKNFAARGEAQNTYFLAKAKLRKQHF